MNFQTKKQIIDLFEKWGSDPYTEQVSQTAHAVQCAVLAEQDRAPSALVVATLLHDIGHLVDLANSEGEYETETDLEHEATGARALASMFPAAVTAPIALHVAAKRYLCTVEPRYIDTLSPTSLHTLNLQGGPMTREQADRFARMPHSMAAVRLRRWDDTGKDSSKTAVPMDEFREMLERHSSQISN